MATFLLTVTHSGMAQGQQMMKGQEEIPPTLGAAGSNRTVETFYSDQSGAPEEWVW